MVDVNVFNLKVDKAHLNAALVLLNVSSRGGGPVSSVETHSEELALLSVWLSIFEKE